MNINVLAKRTVPKQSPFDRRVHEIDFLRGVMIIIVVLDHIFWNLKHFGAIWSDAANGTNSIFNWFADFFGWYWTSDARAVIQPMALMAFCLLSGISCAFSRNNWRRAIETLSVWLIVAVSTNIAQAAGLFSGQGTIRIDLNIIGVLGFSMLFFCLLQKRSWKAIAAVILISFLMSWFFIPSFQNFLEQDFVCGSSTIEKAGHIKTVPNFYFPFFWEPADCFGGSGQADYVPLFPFIMYFFIGALFSYFFYRDKKKSLVRKFAWERPVCFLGRHTFIIYIAHQFFFMGFFNLLNVIILSFY